MSGLSTLFKTSRPRFWIYLLGPVLLGSVAALTSGGRLSWLAVCALLVFTFPANLFLYGINDIFDQETDRLNPKKQGYETLLDPRSVKRLLWAIVLGIVPAVLLFLFLPRPALIAFLLFLFLGAFYSAPPIRAKAIPFLDSAFNSLYLMPGLVAWYAFGGEAISWPVIGAGALWCMAMHAYSAIPDIEADQTSTLQTVATILGKNGTLTFCLLLYVASAGLFYVASPGTVPLILGIVYILLMLRSLRTRTTSELFTLYRLFPWVNALVGFGLFWWIVVTKSS